MGGKSTSQGAVLNGKKVRPSSGFDLHSWQGLTEVLRRGKESLKDSDSYADFRNLVLEYAQGGGDAELRKQIDTVITSFTKVGVEPPKESQQTKKRQRVRKNKVQKEQATVEIVNEVEEYVEPTVHKIEQQSVQQAAPVSPVRESRTKPSFKASVQQQMQETVPEPVLPKIPKPTPTLESQNVVEVPKLPKQASKVEPQVQTVPVQVEESMRKPEAPSFKSIDEHKARIIEIKRLVHEQIGNPVALLSSHNDFGKKYMVALLAALKSTGSGSAESPDRAMRRLEDAYKALIEEPVAEEIKETPEIIIEPEKIAKPAVVKDFKSESVPEPQEVIKEEKPAPLKPVPAPPKRTPPKPKLVPVPPKPIPTPVSNTTQPQPQKDEKHVETEKVPMHKPSEIKITAQTKKEIESEEQLEVETSKPKLSPVNTLKALLVEDESDIGEDSAAKPTETSEKTPLKELPDDKMKVAGVSTAPILGSNIRHTKFTKKGIGKNINSGYEPVDAVDLTKIAVKQTELSSPKVSEALHQLLHEWALFKSSGLLGIGPGGSEHPLYQKLAPLSMGEVVSGRWEGSDRKVTKTIKQYVDAWRHEQSVAYNIQETFDHYLRRVVLRIQQRKAGDE